MSETTADGLKWLLRVYAVVAFVYFVAGRSHRLGREAELAWVFASMLAVWLTIYLEFFLGVAVVGLVRVFGIPQGRRFAGLPPGEEAILRFNFAYGMIGIAGYNGVFKLLLTNRRLLVGANLTNWFLVEIPLAEVARASVKPRRWIFPSTLALVQSGSSGTTSWKIGLSDNRKFEELRAALVRLGVHLESEAAPDLQSIPRL